jgi:hypothetical protein
MSRPPMTHEVKRHSAEVMAQVMKAQDLTPDALAQRMGCTRANIYYLLTHGAARRSTLDRLASALGVEVAELAGEGLPVSGLDPRQTPAWATRALLVRLGGLFDRRSPIVEPCAGQGRMADALTRAGFAVVTGDVDPTYKPHRVWDFVAWAKANRASARPERFDQIVTCPPRATFAHKRRQYEARDFVEAALSCAPTVAMLLHPSALDPALPAPRLRLEIPRLAMTQGGHEATDAEPMVWAVWVGVEEVQRLDLRWPTLCDRLDDQEAARLGRPTPRGARPTPCP